MPACMRKLANSLFRRYLRFRMGHIRRYMTDPHGVQRYWLERLLIAARDTEWGRKYDYRSIRSCRQFAARVPIQDYDSLKPYIQRMIKGEKEVLWNGRVRWFSKSSGTTNDRSKFIPVSSQNLRFCHVGGSWDTMALFYDQRPDAEIFRRKCMLMGGSLKEYGHFRKTFVGDVSAVMISRMPWVARPFFTPDFKTALMDDFEKKINRMVELCSSEDVVMIGGVPTWTVVLFRRMLEYTGKKNMLEIWPNFQVYIHGGVSFTPYREQFKRFFPSQNAAGKKVDYQEIYNASEGYFAVQNERSSDDMLLLLDNGIYYEFLPMEEWQREHPRAIPLEEVETGKNYAIVISTNSGLWRYTPGDTIAFTSLRPYKIKVTGRTRQFVNVFGEEVTVENADKALALTCRQTGASVLEYTVAPIFLEGSRKGGHEWLVEFDHPPADPALFARRLDENLQHINSDYEAKRFRDMALRQLRLHPVPSGTFYQWLKMKGKYGGQHKVPHLSNERKYVEEILAFLDREIVGGGY